MKKCFLCQSSADDKFQYGEFLHKRDVYVHKNCLYLTAGLRQEGSDHEGIMGFLIKTIRAKTETLKRYQCFFCKQKYANIVCCFPKCQRRYHTICGIDNDVQYEFAKQFRSFCTKHLRPVKHRPPPNALCYICYEKLKAAGEHFNSVRMLGAPCCRNGWFHKLCLQKYAISAGYFFKCPLCNDSERFRNHMSYRGIFIPDQDAAWELEPNAFQELTDQPRSCVAEACKNQDGRDEQSDENPFITCQTCGACAMHTQCLDSASDNFNCKDCLISLQNCHSPVDGEEDVDNETDSFIDVETVENDTQTAELNSTIENISQHNENAQQVQKFNEQSSDSENELTIIASHLRRRKGKRKKINVLQSPETDDVSNIDSSSDESGVLVFKRKKRRLVLDDETDNSLDNTLEDDAKEDVAINNYDNNNLKNTRKYNKKKYADLDASCIAKRTRNNSTFHTTVRIKEFQSKKSLNFSCIANRTRRRYTTRN